MFIFIFKSKFNIIICKEYSNKIWKNKKIRKYIKNDTYYTFYKIYKKITDQFFFSLFIYIFKQFSQQME